MLDDSTTVTEAMSELHLPVGFLKAQIVFEANMNEDKPSTFRTQPLAPPVSGGALSDALLLELTEDR